MNNNFYEIPNDWYSEFNENFMNSINNPMDNMNMPNMSNMPGIPNMFNMPGMNNNMTNNLADPKVALDRGNLFNNLYDPYKNYKYRALKASNKREELLLDILKHNFALTEINLYLDVNPRDMNMIGLYNRYLANKKSLIDEFEKSFGPLTLDGLNMGSNDWNWNNRPWPWEGTK